MLGSSSTTSTLVSVTTPWSRCWLCDRCAHSEAAIPTYGIASQGRARKRADDQGHLGPPNARRRRAAEGNCMNARRLVVPLVVVAAVGGGAVAGAIIGIPGSSGAQESTTTTTTPSTDET